MPDLHELGQERRQLLERLDALKPQIRVAAVHAVWRGEPKFYVAADAGVSRPTLDKWVNEFAVMSQIEADGRPEGKLTLPPEVVDKMNGDFQTELNRIMHENGFIEFAAGTREDPWVQWRNWPASMDAPESVHPWRMP